MDLKILNKDFEVIAIVDSYQSIMWCKRYNEIGAIDLQVLASPENIKIFQEGNFIVRDDDDSVFRIEAIEIDTSSEESNYMIIGGVEIKKILHQRIVYETEKYTNKTVENVMRGMVNNNIINPTDSLRKINNFYLKEPKGLSDTITTQITYSNVGEKIESLCKTYNYGYKVTLENQNLYFDVFKGKDKTANQSENLRVIFSAEYDNLFSSKYNFDKSEFKNVALVGGEGEGIERKKREIGTAEGIDRFEIFVDASGVSSENGAVSDSEYYNLLFEQGKEALTETNVTTSFEAMVDTSFYKYKKDFDLGDVVTITNEYGISANARITEIIETWDENGYALEPKFDYIEVFELGENDVLSTEAGVMMLSERGIALLNENSPSTEGVKISELEPVEELYNGCCFPIVQNGETKKVEYSIVKQDIKDTVNDAIANVIAKAPEDFDTLKEISDWIDEHEDSASAMNSAILENRNKIETLGSDLFGRLSVSWLTFASLGFTVGSTVSVRNFWRALCNKIGSNGFAKVSWANAQSGYVGSSSNNIEFNGGFIIFGCGNPNATWQDFSAIYVKWDGTTYSISCRISGDSSEGTEAVAIRTLA